MSHFPGPWQADGLAVTGVDHGRRYRLLTATHTLLAKDAAAANARLAAAAPDLLAALQRIATLDPRDWDLAHIARTAIATATGDPS